MMAAQFQTYVPFNCSCPAFGDKAALFRDSTAFLLEGGDDKTNPKKSLFVSTPADLLQSAGYPLFAVVKMSLNQNLNYASVRGMFVHFRIVPRPQILNAKQL